MTRLWMGLAMMAIVLPVAFAIPAWQARVPALAFRSTALAGAPASASRVEVDLARKVASWQGRDGCAAPARARLALRPVVAHWLGTQMMAHPERTLTQWGYHSGDIWTERRTVDGKPRCSGGFRKLIVYADFR